jgi:Tol biopolymer transport system component
VLASRASGTDGASGNRASYEPSISGDGRFVAFESTASNLDPGDTDAGAGFEATDIFVRDLQTSQTTLVSRASGPTGADGDGSSDSPSMSSDGRFVAFDSGASNLHPGDTRADTDVFVRDLQTGATTLLTPRSRRHRPESPSISATGRYIAYESETRRAREVFVHDLQVNRTVLVSRATGRAGAPAGSESTNASISASGRYVVFESYASRLQPFVTSRNPDIFLRDLGAGTTRLISRASGRLGATGRGGSHVPEISADGRFVVFESRSSNLHPGDRDRSGDVFVRDLGVPPREPAPRASCLGRRASMILLRGSAPAEGSRAADVIAGSRGPDRIEGASGRDRICGRAGRDLIDSADGHPDIVDCGTGRDRVVADRIDRVWRCERS